MAATYIQKMHETYVTHNSRHNDNPESWLVPNLVECQYLKYT